MDSESIAHSVSRNKEKKNTLFVKNRDPMESLGNDDVSPLNSPKYEIVRDNVNRKCSKGSLGLIL